jgi:hypothetical protein
LLQILLKFSKKFWPSSHSLVVCSDCFVPQFWTYPMVSDCNVIMGFAAGDQARNIGQLSAEVIVDSFLKQLDAIYASQANGGNPGTPHYSDYWILIPLQRQLLIRITMYSTGPNRHSFVVHIHPRALGRQSSIDNCWVRCGRSKYAPNSSL